jgi:outer membrane lipopolysaccharide assembly protein LptE/RlpB
MESSVYRSVVRGLFVIVALSVLCACGYTFKGSGSALPPDVVKINIPLAENNTVESGLGLVVTEALRDRFDRFGVITVVDSESEADAVLRAKVLKLQRESQTSTSQTDTVLQARTVLVMAAELRRITGPLLWSNPNLLVSKAFGTSSSVVVTSSADFAGGNLSASDLSALDTRELSRGEEKKALEDLAEEVARRVYDEAVAPEF